MRLLVPRLPAQFSKSGQSVHIGHDALYRVVNADYDYTQPGGARTTADSGSDWRESYARAAAVDPMRSEPPAMVVPEADTRVISLAWSWDYLANTNEWTDDRESFYERSIGTITNGDDTTESDSTRPSALYLATNLASAGSGSGPAPEHGWLEVDYGVGGNMTSMTVHAQCVDGPSACVDPGGDLGSRRAALRTGCACAVEQHYAYRWDELNRLAEARRYDRTPMTAGAWRSEVRQRYRYDGANARMVKQTLDAEGCGSGPSMTPCERIALYPYPGDFERRGLSRGFGEYTVDPDVLRTETQYIVAGARIVSRVPASADESFDADERIVVPLTDLIQTTAAAFDVRTGRLIEASTYYPNGGRETFLDDAEARAPPEPSGFTGKEADEEVGVVYFGERYLVPRIGRWASPDPLHVHAVGGGEALNSYHYVAGNLLVTRDPLGLTPPTSAYLRSRSRLIMMALGFNSAVEVGLQQSTAEAAGVPARGGWRGSRGQNISMYRQDSHGQMILTPTRIMRTLSNGASARFVSQQIRRYYALDPDIDVSLVLSFAVHESGTGVLRDRPGRTIGTFGGSGADSIAYAAENRGAFVLPRDFRVTDVEDWPNERRRIIPTGRIRANDEFVAYASLVNYGRRLASVLVPEFSSLSVDAQRTWTVLGTRPGTMRQLVTRIETTTTSGSPDYERIVSDPGLAGLDSVRVARVKAADAAFLERTLDPSRVSQRAE